MVSPNPDGSGKYDFEIADYDETTGYIEVYFRQPTVSASADGTFYFAYDDPTVMAYQPPPTPRERSAARQRPRGWSAVR